MNLIFTHLADTVHILQDVFYVVLMIRIVASFFPPRSAGLWDKAAYISTQLTEPILAPIRRRVPLVGMLDLSPLIAFFLVDIASFVLVRMFLYLARF
ncbi:MAG: YggT family protein [Firmicutes bacterium]|uniref:YggT family protein n=1 Tax=Sulfobacillus benefaciens TaxID=453960 RepID=A0A2T2X6U6_9FIRM|nr:YggT family protein [Bacillota bacterium]MCL5013820.1 YggT family protein [Bacillota bacterium]PSR30223.1 MAG: YggT family protein [Sulfobacillus benefaciens]